jgi:AAHS family 4-hydroxybenzoate transporter-like MFS transporter
VDEILDSRRPGWRQITIALLCLLVLAIDGLDYQMLAYVAPMVIDDFGISKTELGTAISAALIGMAAGAITGGAIGDRIGRKPAIVFTALFFGLTTIATGFASNATELFLLRLVSGFGFGVAFPNAFALTAEWMPTRYRAMAVSIGAVGSALGGLAGAGVAAWVIPAFGWRHCFWFSGGFTLLATILLALLLVESPYHLLKGGQREKLAHILRSMFGPVELPPAPAVASVRPGTPAIITSRLYLRTNLALWVSAIGFSIASFGTYSWTTTILTSAGHSLNSALLGSSTYSSLALVGPLISGAIATWLPPRTVLLGLSVIWVAATIGLLSILLNEGDAMLLFAALGVIGFCAGSFAAVLYAAAAGLYEPAGRSTGIGATIGVTRICGMIAAAVGGALLTIDPSFRAFYISMALLLVISMLGLLALPRVPAYTAQGE